MGTDTTTDAGTGWLAAKAEYGTRRNDREQAARALAEIEALRAQVDELKSDLDEWEAMRNEWREKAFAHSARVTELLESEQENRTEWGAKWTDGGYCPSTPPRSEEFARKHAHNFGTRPIRRVVGPWVYADTGEHVFDDQTNPATEEGTR
jgi:hypothetical protein